MVTSSTFVRLITLMDFSSTVHDQTATAELSHCLFSLCSTALSTQDGGKDYCTIPVTSQEAVETATTSDETWWSFIIYKISIRCRAKVHTVPKL